METRSRPLLPKGIVWRGVTCLAKVRWFGKSGSTVYKYALEVVILAHGDGEMGWFGADGVVVYNYVVVVVGCAKRHRTL